VLERAAAAVRAAKWLPSQRMRSTRWCRPSTWAPWPGSSGPRAGNPTAPFRSWWGPHDGEELASELSNRFFILARRFWPGPLTIIVPASARVPLKLTGNTGRLALRQSCSKVANQLIARLNQPLISTSANISGRPTCRSGIDVFGMMDGRVDLVIDGGACNGAGATTVDITEPYWRLIRAGAIEEKEIADACSRRESPCEM